MKIPSSTAVARMIVFCSDPLKPRDPDAAFAREAAAAEQLGLAYELIDFEALVLENDCQRAARQVQPRGEITETIYRGWMLKPTAYARLYDALAAKNVRLINDPIEYRHCHYLPESYAAIEGHTPRSVWLTFVGEVPLERIMESLRQFGTAPVIIKDFVKSRKHEWEEACFIPSAADR